MTEALTVTPEAGKRDAQAFLELPYRLYRDHPVWIPPLRVGEREMFDQEKNPFFEHASVQHFLARRGTRVVGRIAAIKNDLHNETFSDHMGFFGFFDVEPDPEAAQALVDAARAWVREQGLTRIRGPVNYSTNDTCGVLVDGFDLPPLVMMPYNREDYDALLLGAGLTQAKDLLAFWITDENELPERFVRVVERRLKKSDIVLRPIDVDDLEGEIVRLSDVYNRCWADNWGFVPATAAEFQHAAKQMKLLLEPDCSAVAEANGVPVGLSIVIRDLNSVLRGTNGRLFPKGIFRLLFRLKKVKWMRVIALGVVPEARGRGINEALFLRAAITGVKKGYTAAEAGWILEENALMTSPIQAVGGYQHKRYRIYESDV